MAASRSSSTNTMSLVPYEPEQSREIVLRHNSTVVVFDQRSKQLLLRNASRQSTNVDLTNCPTCHRPLRDEYTSHERAESPPDDHDVNHWMDQSYFRLLQHSTTPSSTSSPPPSPRRRIVQPVQRDVNGALLTPPGAEFVGSEPVSPPRTSGISSNAFSQGYFKTFFKEEGELGRGGKGVVLLVRHVLDGVSLGQFACKRVPVGDDHAWLKKVLVEVQLLQNLSHQNLVSYRHVWLEDFQISQVQSSVPCAFILQQFCNAGDLHHYVLDPARVSVTTEQLKDRMRRRSKGAMDRPGDLHGPRRMNFEDIYSFFKDIASGVHHLHANGYIHRDLKPSNCLLHHTGHKLRVLVSDFGEVQMENAARKSTGTTGTISYCAPEVLQRDLPTGAFGNFSTKSDVFSLGMIVYFMCFGGLPYSQADNINEEKEDLDELREEITTWAGFDDERRVRTDLPDMLYKFLKRLLALDPEDRPSTDEILQGIRAGSNLEELDTFSRPPVHPNMLDDLRHRIRPVDSAPSTPTRRASSSKTPSLGSLKGFQRNTGGPGPSNLRPSPSPSPPIAPVRSHSPSKRATSQYAEDEYDSEHPTSSTALIPTLNPRKQRVHSVPRHTTSSDRLALPPPPARPSRIPNFLASPTATISVKIAFFILKVVALTRPCDPYAARAWIAYPLLALAIIDFLPSDEGHGIYWLRRSLGLLVLHSMLVWFGVKGRFLCPNPRFIMEGDEVGEWAAL
ncbi:kinase-like protein [Venturia nashicola]|uniref:non-specific serine/threonine protein kinase n=1 Tax=Venturia nashicola TaxID=86259 RepID=A0A4Z1P8M8_9PEZI|nr:kinase-like protein [Venturia nashicola]TLD32535.1 kinase-like protein [Venturia nashicola]